MDYVIELIGGGQAGGEVAEERRAGEVRRGVGQRVSVWVGGEL